MSNPKPFEQTWDHVGHKRPPAGGPFVAHRTPASDFSDDDSRACVTCGRHLRSTDPGTLVRFECAECLEPKAQGPAVAFVHWRGVRFGFDSLDKALGFIRVNKEANDPRYYCGPVEELPVLEVEQSVEAK